MSKSFFGFHDDVYVAVVYFPPEKREESQHGPFPESKRISKTYRQ